MRRKRKEEEETSQSPFGKAQGNKRGWLPPKPCYRNQTKLIHHQFIYPDDQEISAAAWNSSVHHGCHKRPQMNHNITQSSSHHHALFVCLILISTLPSYLNLVCLHLYSRDVDPTQFLYTVLHNLHSQSQKQNLTVFHSNALLSLLLQLFDGTAVLEGTVKNRFKSWQWDKPWTRLAPSLTKLGLLFQKYLGAIHKGTHAVTCYVAISFSPERAEVRFEHESTPALTLT